MKRATETAPTGGSACWTDSIEHSYERWFRAGAESVAAWADRVERSYEQLFAAAGQWAAATAFEASATGGRL